MDKHVQQHETHERAHGISTPQKQQQQKDDINIVNSIQPSDLIHEPIDFWNLDTPVDNVSLYDDDDQKDQNDHTKGPFEMREEKPNTPRKRVTINTEENTERLYDPNSDEMHTAEYQDFIPQQDTITKINSRDQKYGLKRSRSKRHHKDIYPPNENASNIPHSQQPEYIVDSVYPSQQQQQQQQQYYAPQQYKHVNENVDYNYNESTGIVDPQQYDEMNPREQYTQQIDMDSNVYPVHNLVFNEQHGSRESLVESSRKIMPPDVLKKRLDSRYESYPWHSENPENDIVQYDDDDDDDDDHQNIRGIQDEKEDTELQHGYHQQPQNQSQNINTTTLFNHQERYGNDVDKIPSFSLEGDGDDDDDDGMMENDPDSLLYLSKNKQRPHESMRHYRPPTPKQQLESLMTTGERDRKHILVDHNISNSLEEEEERNDREQKDEDTTSLLATGGRYFATKEILDQAYWFGSISYSLKTGHPSNYLSASMRKLPFTRDMVSVLDIPYESKEQCEHAIRRQKIPKNGDRVYSTTPLYLRQNTIQTKHYADVCESLDYDVSRWLSNLSIVEKQTSLAGNNNRRPSLSIQNQCVLAPIDSILPDLKKTAERHSGRHGQFKNPKNHSSTSIRELYTLIHRYNQSGSGGGDIGVRTFEDKFNQETRFTPKFGAPLVIRLAKLSPQYWSYISDVDSSSSRQMVDKKQGGNDEQSSLPPCPQNLFTQGWQHDPIHSGDLVEIIPMHYGTLYYDLDNKEIRFNQEHTFDPQKHIYVWRVLKSKTGDPIRDQDPTIRIGDEICFEALQYYDPDIIVNDQQYAMQDNIKHDLTTISTNHHSNHHKNNGNNRENLRYLQDTLKRDDGTLLNINKTTLSPSPPQRDIRVSRGIRNGYERGVSKRQQQQQARPIDTTLPLCFRNAAATFDLSDIPNVFLSLNQNVYASITRRRRGGEEGRGEEEDKNTSHKDYFFYSGIGLEERPDSYWEIDTVEGWWPWNTTKQHSSDSNNNSSTIRRKKRKDSRYRHESHSNTSEHSTDSWSFDGDKRVVRHDGSRQSTNTDQQVGRQNTTNDRNGINGTVESKKQSVWKNLWVKLSGGVKTTHKDQNTGQSETQGNEVNAIEKQSVLGIHRTTIRNVLIGLLSASALVYIYSKYIMKSRGASRDDDGDDDNDRSRRWLQFPKRKHAGFNILRRNGRQKSNVNTTHPYKGGGGGGGGGGRDENDNDRNIQEGSKSASDEGVDDDELLHIMHRKMTPAQSMYDREGDTMYSPTWQRQYNGSVSPSQRAQGRRVHKTIEFLNDDNRYGNSKNNNASLDMFQRVMMPAERKFYGVPETKTHMHTTKNMDTIRDQSIHSKNSDRHMSKGFRKKQYSTTTTPTAAPIGIF